jgi:hypothetical protein
LALFLVHVLNAADHGPVFGLATPTNPAHCWSFNLGANGRNGTAGVAAALQAELSYGLTENLKLAASAPLWSGNRCAACVSSGGDAYPVAVYRGIGTGAGMQFPLYRNVGSVFPAERHSFAINFAYFC